MLQDLNCRSYTRRTHGIARAAAGLHPDATARMDWRGSGRGARVQSESKGEVRVPVASETDLIAARKQGRLMAEELGLSPTDATLVATAISELARNIVHYAEKGEILIRLVKNGHRHGVSVEARDEGPGMVDTRLAMQEGYSSSGGLGLGLPGVRRIMDEFDISSAVGRGTRITVTKWKG